MKAILITIGLIAFYAFIIGLMRVSAGSDERLRRLSRNRRSTPESGHAPPQGPKD